MSNLVSRLAVYTAITVSVGAMGFTGCDRIIRNSQFESVDRNTFSQNELFYRLGPSIAILCTAGFSVVNCASYELSREAKR